MQEKQFELMLEESKIQAQLLTIQAFFSPHLVVLEKHLNIAKDLIQGNMKLSIVDNMIHHVATLEIHKKNCNELKTNWDNIIAMILTSHKPFFWEVQYTSWPPVANKDNHEKIKGEWMNSWIRYDQSTIDEKFSIFLCILD